MAIPYVSAHTPNAAGTDRGTYSRISECHLRNISDDHMAVQVEHSLFEGDRMTFYQILTSRDNELDWSRPIRFYTADGTKLFDGVIIDTAYTYLGSDYMALRVNAAGWWQELARMNFHRPVEYDETWCVDDIYLDLVRLANDKGMMKEALYTYDTTRIPEYSAYSSLYDTPTGTTFTFGNIYEGMRMLTQYLDIAHPDCTYEFGLRIETLARPNDDAVDAIDETDVEDHIYILPFALNQDKTAVATYKRFQLGASYNVTRDYRHLANDCFAIGDGFETQQIRTIVGQEATTQILESVEVPDSGGYYAPDNKPLSSHYLRVNIENPGGIPAHGTVAITFDDGVDEITDYLIFDLSTTPAGQSSTQTQYTSIRSHDGITLPSGIHVTDFGGWTPAIKISIDEVTDAGGNNTTIAGKSVNTHGIATKTIEGMWLNTQARVDYAAGKYCRLHHAPSHKLYAPVIHRYVGFDNLIGNTANFYSPYEASISKFVVNECVYGFKGKLATQHLMGTRWEYDWDFDDS